MPQGLCMGAAEWAMERDSDLERFSIPQHTFLSTAAPEQWSNPSLMEGNLESNMVAIS